MPTAIFLVFTACIGQQCHEVGLGSFPSVKDCTDAAFPAIAEWMGQHRAYTGFKFINCTPEPADEGDDL